MAINIPIKTHWSLFHNSWSILSKNRIISLATNISFMLSFISIIIIVISLNKLPPVVPLWYSKPWGADRLANPAWLFILPISSLFITGMNISIASVLTNEYLVFSQTLALGSLVISSLSTITLLKIIFMVM